MDAGTKTPGLNRGRLGIELERAQHPRVHIVGADQHRQFDDAAVIEMAPDRGSKTESGTAISRVMASA